MICRFSIVGGMLLMLMLKYLGQRQQEKVSILRFLPDFGGRLLLPGPFAAIKLDRNVHQNFVFI